MQVNPNDFLCCAGGDFVCPGTCKVARLDKTEGLKNQNAADMGRITFESNALN